MKMIKPVVLALIFALLLASANTRTREVIAGNRIHYAQKLLRQMADGGDVVESQNGYEIHRTGKLAGYIHELETTDGYNGLIQLLVAVNLEPRILSVRVTHHRETPGLGDKIDHRVSDWINRFNGHGLTSDFALQSAGDFDGITGATITSRAVVKAVKKGLER